jgi:hypothetical protein
VVLPGTSRESTSGMEMGASSQIKTTEATAGPTRTQLLFSARPGAALQVPGTRPFCGANERPLDSDVRHAGPGRWRDERSRGAALRAPGFCNAVDHRAAGSAGSSSPRETRSTMSLVRGMDSNSLKPMAVRPTTGPDWAGRRARGGVETGAARAVLKELGCDLSQGLGCANPSPPFSGRSR